MRSTLFKMSTFLTFVFKVLSCARRKPWWEESESRLSKNLIISAAQRNGKLLLLHQKCFYYFTKNILVALLEEENARKWQKCQSRFGALSPWLAAWDGHGPGGLAPHLCRWAGTVWVARCCDGVMGCCGFWLFCVDTSDGFPLTAATSCIFGLGLLRRVLINRAKCLFSFNLSVFSKQTEALITVLWSSICLYAHVCDIMHATKGNSS